jgi:hypothetical protein
MADQQEFSFPDEIEAERDAQRRFHEQQEGGSDNEDGLEIKVEDDTPEEDRGRIPLPKNVVEELEKDDLEEYSEKVKKRLSQMKKVWHDERREKERAAREKEEALRFAQQQMQLAKQREDENRQLKQRLGVGEKAFLQEANRAADNDLAIAKDRFRQAYESGDSDKLAEAQELLTPATLRKKEIERYKPSLQDQEERVEQNQQVPVPQVSAPVVDKKAEAWRERNTWFGSNKGMTAFALGLHEELVDAGVDPRSDDYYQRVDETMKKRFPEAFDYADETPNQTKEQPKTVPRTKPANVVAPVTRATAPRQVRLTPSQIAIAKKLGLSNQEYAKAMIELENDNG